MRRIQWIFVGLVILVIGFAGGFIVNDLNFLSRFQSTDAPTNNEAPNPDTPLQAMLKQVHDLPADLPMSLNTIGTQYQIDQSRQLKIWLGEQFDEDACNQLADWDIDYDLDTWDDQIAPYYDAFVEDGLGGYFPPTDNINVIFREQVQDTDTYTVDYLVTTTRGPDDNVRSYLMLPKAPPPDENGYPVVILLHASNNLIESVVGLHTGPDRTKTAGVRWAERGVVVLAVDGNDNPSVSVMETARLLNRNGYFLNVQRIHSAVDWLTTQADFPVHRIGTYGISYGGYLSFWAGITDERIDVVAANGFARDFTQWIFTNPTTAPEPMLRNWFEFMDWCTWETSTQARFIAPRRLLLEVGNRDKSTLIGDFTNPRTAPEPVDSRIFDIMADRIQDTYDRLGISDRFRAVKFDGGHEMISDETENWIYEQLTRPLDVP